MLPLGSLVGDANTSFSIVFATMTAKLWTSMVPKRLWIKEVQFAFWSAIKETCAIDLFLTQHKYTTLIIHLLCEHRFGGKQK